MPRGKRKTSREKLEELRETIASQEAQLKELRQRERTAETAKRGGAAPPGSDDGRTAGERG
ncbi:MAG: hypothetical protein ACLUD8_12310 [Clostridium sp.]